MNSSSRKICVFTGTRSEYGLLRPLMDEIQNEPGLILQILATGMHMSPEFGLTYKLIEADGFEIDEKVEMLLSSDSATGIAKAIALGIISFIEALGRLKPDLVVILGDRFEGLAMAQSCMIARIPITHLHGGEATHGLIDEAIRHAITKMSHLHFTSTEEYRRRVIQLGEHPDRVFNVGAIGIENIKRLSLLSKEELERDIGFDLGNRYFLVTFHPVTLEQSTAEGQFKELLNALDQVTSDSNELMRIVFTKTNADTDGRIINQLIDEYVAVHSDKAIAFTSMGAFRYLSAMKHASAVIGNSSSGIIEAPAFKVPTVNIGQRQKGRVQAPSIINCEPEVNSILEGIATALSPAFIASLSGMTNPYDRSNTVATIVGFLKKINLEGLINKTFYDLCLS